MPGCVTFNVCAAPALGSNKHVSHSSTKGGREGEREGGREGGHSPSPINQHLCVGPNRPRNLRLAPPSLPASLDHPIGKPDPPNIRLPIIECGNGPLRASDLLGDRLEILPILLRGPGHVPMVQSSKNLVLSHNTAVAGIACEGGRGGREGGGGGCERKSQLILSSTSNKTQPQSRMEGGKEGGRGGCEY